VTVFAIAIVVVVDAAIAVANQCGGRARP